MSDDDARKGYQNIASKFRDADDYGLASVRMFLEDSHAFDGMTAEQVQTDAFMQVNAWINQLGLDI